MSNEERAYMLTIGDPLDRSERDIALEIHYERRRLHNQNIARLEAELAQQRQNIGHSEHMIATLADQWPDLGPNTMLQITHQTRLDILNGVRCSEIEVGIKETHTITPRYVPDFTAERDPRRQP